MFSIMLALREGGSPVTGEFWCKLDQSVEQTMKLSVIWDAMTPMWHHCYAIKITSILKYRSIIILKLSSSELVFDDGHDVLKKSGKYPCAVCCSGVGNNSIQCSQLMLWVPKKCSGIAKRLVADSNYVCHRCLRPIDGRTVTEVGVDGTMLDGEATFCYLGDMLGSGGGCDSAIATRRCVARGKFRKLLPVLNQTRLT